MTDLASARAAVDEIIEQGEGARGDWRPAHYGRFFGIWKEYQQLREQDPFFEPARPVLPAFTQQPYDIEQRQPARCCWRACWPSPEASSCTWDWASGAAVRPARR